MYNNYIYIIIISFSIPHLTHFNPRVPFAISFFLIVVFCLYFFLLQNMLIHHSWTHCGYTSIMRLQCIVASLATSCRYRQQNCSRNVTKPKQTKRNETNPTDQTNEMNHNWESNAAWRNNAQLLFVPLISSSTKFCAQPIAQQNKYATHTLHAYRTSCILHTAYTTQWVNH